MCETISMTKARQIVAEKSNSKTRPQVIDNHDVFNSDLFTIISGPGTEAIEYSVDWKLELKK